MRPTVQLSCHRRASFWVTAPLFCMSRPTKKDKRTKRIYVYMAAKAAVQKEEKSSILTLSIPAIGRRFFSVMSDAGTGRECGPCASGASRAGFPFASTGVTALVYSYLTQANCFCVFGFVFHPVVFLSKNNMVFFETKRRFLRKLCESHS